MASRRRCRYQVTDAYGQTAAATYTPSVVPPSAPAPPPLTSRGPVHTPQHVGTAAVAGATTTMVDGKGRSVTSIVVNGQGTYSFTGSTGRLTFVPVDGFSGVAHSVTYKVTDAYGQSGVATYTATVVPPAAPIALPRTDDRRRRCPAGCRAADPGEWQRPPARLARARRSRG